MAKKQRQRRPYEVGILTAAARGNSLQETALQNDVSIRTVQRRWADPEFCRQVQSLREKMVNRAAGGLCASAAGAVECLAGLLTNESASVRLGASRAILEQTIRYRELVHTEERLQHLESALLRLKGIPDENRH